MEPVNSFGHMWKRERLDMLHSAIVTPNAAVERRRAALSSAQQAHNEMARLLRASDCI
jgi:hypothetical protein